MCSSAPANSTTRPWITTIMSRLICGMSNESAAALVEDAEQDGCEDDADRMVAPHQRDRDADEAEAAGEFEEDAMLIAQELVGPDSTGERAGQEHGDHDHAGPARSRHRRRRRIRADGAERVAPAGAPDEDPDTRGSEEREQKRKVEGRSRPRDPDMGEQVVERRHQRRGAELPRLGDCWPGLISTLTSR